MSKGQQTRERIIQQAAPVFNQHGYDGATMSQLMEATGLEKGGIYRHFSSKEELAAESFKFAWSEVLRVRLAGLDEIPSAIGQLRHAISNFIEVRSPIAGGCPLLNTATDCDDGNPVLRDLARKVLTGWQTRLATIVRKGIRSGEIIASASPQATANIIISALEGATMIARLEHSRDAYHHAQQALEAHLQSIATGSKKSRSK